MRRAVAILAGVIWLGSALAAPQPPDHTPPYQRLLRGADARRAAQLHKQMGRLHGEEKFADALAVAQTRAELRAQVQGADHWEAVDARWEVEWVRRVLRHPKAQRREIILSLVLLARAKSLSEKGQYQAAQALGEKALAARRRILGEDHPDTAVCYNNLALALQQQGRHDEAAVLYRKALAICCAALGEDHPRTATAYSNLAVILRDLGQYREAEANDRKALAIDRKVLGEDDQCMAIRYASLASSLDAQGQYTEAEKLYRQALILYRKTPGDDPLGLTSFYYTLANNLRTQGKYAEALVFDSRALALHRKFQGEDHPHTALAYNNLANDFHVQGKYAEAAVLYRKALAGCRKTLGEDHPETATCYANLAWILRIQGGYAEAAQLHYRALKIRYNALGKDHPETANSYDDLASMLQRQGRYEQAGALFLRALDISRKAQGEDHPNTALCYNHLADNLRAQGKHAEAEALYRKALTADCHTFGEAHPRTATAYNNLASNLFAQGKFTAAAELHAQSLAIRDKAQEKNPFGHATATMNLAEDLHALGQYDKAEALWLAAADRFGKVRLQIAASGLDRAAKTGVSSPLPGLAAVLARNGKPEDAWQRYEESLARGTWDDLSGRLRLPAAVQQCQAELCARLGRLDRLIERTAALKKPTAAQDGERKALLARWLKTQDELAVFTRQLEETYGPAAGQVFARAKIQAALPADAALIGWLDLPGHAGAADPKGEHWAILLRSAGPPVWVRLRGTGPGGAWTEADTRLPADMYAALQLPRSAWQPLARRLRAQRLDPLAQHLKAGGHLPAVKRLVILPSQALAAVPVETIADDYRISYAPSGTLFAHLRRQPKVSTQGLLAVADPVFDAPAHAAEALPLPPGGALVTLVTPGSNAAASGLRPNDVLLRYGTTVLTGPGDLPRLAPAAGKAVTVTVWRDGRTLRRQVRPGPLGAVLAAKPAREALAEQHRLDRRLAAAARGGNEKWAQLPGTRVEIEALRRLFDQPGAAKVLTDSEASEQRLDELARGGELGGYRYLHLATHGEVDDRFPLRSAVILARDQLPDADKQLEAGQPAYDGRLTAAEVLANWRLHSELVTLSACQTALGKYERGEGFVGFAQALLLAGSRSVCLSQWRVDDGATALLMDRFYQNLLGRRAGLKSPLPKAEALREAKQWLRTLPRAEALKRVAGLSDGVTRGKGRTALPLLPAVPQAPAGTDAGADRPYAHPYYWAAFVLIGDPE